MYLHVCIVVGIGVISAACVLGFCLLVAAIIVCKQNRYCTSIEILSVLPCPRKHLRLTCHEDPVSSFYARLLTLRQTDIQADKRRVNITSLAKVITVNCKFSVAKQPLKLQMLQQIVQPSFVILDARWRILDHLHQDTQSDRHTQTDMRHRHNNMLSGLFHLGN